MQCSRNTSPGVNKQNGRQTFPHIGEPKKAFKLQKYDPKRQIKQEFEGKVGKRKPLSSILLKARPNWLRFWANMSRIISLKLTCHFPFSTPRFCEFRPFSVSGRNGGFTIMVSMGSHIGQIGSH